MRTLKTTAIIVLMLGPTASHGTRAAIPSDKLPEHTNIEHTLAENSLGAGFEIAQAPPPMSNRCFTPYFWCYMPGYGPVGAACWCPSPNGPVGGIVR
jgi:hypothetical protein